MEAEERRKEMRPHDRERKSKAERAGRESRIEAERMAAGNDKESETMTFTKDELMWALGTYDKCEQFIDKNNEGIVVEAASLYLESMDANKGTEK